MISSPWAMLITPIWPNVNVRPSAIEEQDGALADPVEDLLEERLH